MKSLNERTWKINLSSPYQIYHVINNHKTEFSFFGIALVSPQVTIIVKKTVNDKVFSFSGAAKTI